MLLSIAVETLSRESVATAPQTTNRIVSAAVTPNTTLSVCGFLDDGAPGESTGGSPSAFRSTRLSGTLWTFQFWDRLRFGEQLPDYPISMPP